MTDSKLSMVEQLKELRKRRYSGEIDEATFERERRALLGKSEPEASEPTAAAVPAAPEPESPEIETPPSVSAGADEEPSSEPEVPGEVEYPPEPMPQPVELREPAPVVLGDLADATGSPTSPPQQSKARYIVIGASVVLVVLAAVLMRGGRTESEGGAPASEADVATRADPSQLIREEATGFVTEYLNVTNQADADRLLRLYADNVDYFSWGVVGKERILGDKKGYFHRWPDVQNTLVGAVDYSVTESADTRRVQFEVDFRVANRSRGEWVKGRARNSLTLKKSNGTIRIVSERQKVLHREKSP